MSSDSVSIVKTIEIYNYLPVIIITIVGYDYVLTFSREIDAVWCRRWTWVSTLFVIIRYVGICWAVTLALAGSTSVRGPINYQVSTKSGYYYFKGIALIEIGDWGYMMFLAAADLMILRVTAMWDKSRIILGILLIIYVPQILVTILWEALYLKPGSSLSVTISQVYMFKSCGYSSIAPSATFRAIPRFVLGAVLLILAAIPAQRQLFEMYRVTKRWHINPTMKLLVREGSVYFIVNLLFNIVNTIQPPIVYLTLCLDALGYALSCAIMPRFIIGIREMYDRDLQERWRGIDTGFGLGSEQVSDGSVSTALVDVILQDGRRADDLVEIELEEVGMMRGGSDQEPRSDPNCRVFSERPSDIK